MSKKQREEFELGFKQGQQFGRQATLNEIKAEIEKQEKWLWQAGIEPYNVDIAFSSIKSVLAESEVEI